MIIFGRLNFICSQFPKFVEKKGGKYVKAIMNEIITHRVKFAFLLRVLPVPIGLQNCVLSVAFYLSHSFFFYKRLIFFYFFPKKKISPLPLWMYQVVSGCGLLVKQVPEVYLGTQCIYSISSIIFFESEAY